MIAGSPLLSVILPVYNGAEYLRAAIDSVLSQTFSDLELVIVDDASTDDSLSIASSVADSRVRVVSLEENVGLAAALNQGISVARGQLIARQDQDDLSAPDRLRRQVDLLSQDPGIELVGTWASVIRQDDSGDWVVVGHHHHPAADDRLRFRLLWNNPFVHSSVVFRRAAFDRAGGYGTDVDSFPEDYDLWSRMATLGRLANVPAELVTYRESPGAMSKASADAVRAGVLRIAGRNLAEATTRASGDPAIANLARSLNGLRTARISPLAAIRRIELFLGAAARTRSSASPQLIIDWCLWSGKLLVRSVVPGRG